MSLNASDDDSQQRFALGFIFALVTLIVATVIGTVVVKHGIAQAPQQPAATAPAAAAEAAAVVEENAARIVVENGVVKFYFASGSADLAEGANEALADVVKAVLEAGKSVQISGYHDATGSAELNAELAKQRAMHVRDALLALAVPQEKLELSKPAEIQGDGSNAEARRVEVTLLP